MRPQRAGILDSVQRQDGRTSRRFEIGGKGATVAYPKSGSLISGVHCFVEGVHFDLTYTAPQELGHKLLAIAISDLAVAGAEPQYALITLGVTQRLNDHFVDEFFSGMRELGRNFSIDIEGGNTTLSPQALVIHVLVVGKKLARKVSTKAKPGDLIVVSGSLGASAAGLNCLRQIGRAVMEQKREIILPHVRPTPRVAEAIELLKSGLATSLIDLGEGLATDLNVLIERGAMGACIDESLLPIAETTERAGRLLTQNHRLWALYGAEDYELLFTARPADMVKVEKIFKRTRVPFSAIGEVTDRRQGVQLRTMSGDVTPFAARGWHHLVRRRAVDE